MIEGRRPAREISRIAEEEAAVVALASHGRGRLARTFLGSICETVGRGAARPLLILGAGAAQA